MQQNKTVEVPEVDEDSLQAEELEQQLGLGNFGLAKLKDLNLDL